MEKRVFITGIGIITGIGNNADETLSSVFASHSGIGEIIHVSTIHKGSIPVSEVKCNNAELFHLLGIPEKEGISRTFLLALMAAKEALKTSGITDISAWKTGLVSATTVGGMDKSELYYQDFLKNDFHNEYIDT
ncbi:MAG TPA: beta-ketoacyl synthase N-terminal-like domain-containing protein, partial [Bacteroidales bacterium]|nr:beta-ketoacyl synthase N-terminal-like domain-containing protein [Bacteroidales bacterium]